MKKEEQILEEVEKTLRSFDKEVMLSENPFLFTRIKAERISRLKKKKRVSVLKVSLNQIILILILLINLVTLAYNIEWSGKENLQEKLVIELKSEFQIDESQNNF